MAVSTVKAFRTNLQTQLENRAGLTGVDVWRYEPGDRATDEYIALLTARIREEHLALGGSRTEEYTIEGRVFVQQPGAGETVADAVHDRMVDLTDEIRQQLVDDDTVNGAVFHAQWRGGDINPLPLDGAWYALYEFEIDVEAHV